jgi:hypothetical protein
MNIPAGWLVQLYAKILLLYPRHFRADFADEMQVVFNLRVKDTVGRSFWRLLLLALRELGALPLALLASYARERRKLAMQKHLNRWFVHAPGSWPEGLLACIPFLMLFLFPGIFSFSRLETGVPAPLGLGLLGLVVLSLALLGMIGLLVRLPRWAMPYAGVLLSLGVFFVLMLSGVFTYFFSGQNSAPWWLRMVTFEAVYLCVLAAAIILVVWLAYRIPMTTAFYGQVQRDWSIISFAMYGGAMVFILGMYEDISGGGWYILITAVPLLLGTWIYLHHQAKQGRILALSIAITLAIGIALVANLQLLDWVSPLVFEIGGLGITRSVLSIILTWLLCEAMLFMPMLLSRIPFSKQTYQLAG